MWGLATFRDGRTRAVAMLFLPRLLAGFHVRLPKTQVFRGNGKKLTS